MFWLPRPFPDEIVGSVLARASRLLGLPLSNVIRSSTGISCPQVSHLLPAGLANIARLMNLPAEEVLQNHTIFPYIAAFSSAGEREIMMAKVFRPSGRGESLAGLTGTFTPCTSFRRYCRFCLREDMERYGVAYWHRVHLLPGVHSCARHGRPLRAVKIPIHRGTVAEESALPGDLPSRSYRHCLRPRIRYGFIEVSQRALQTTRGPLELNLQYRSQAFALGYGFGRDLCAGQAFSADFRAFFGQRFLAELGCNYDVNRTRAWPELMLRKARPALLTTVKHILVRTFLESAKPVGDKPLAYGGVHASPRSKMSRYPVTWPGAREPYIGEKVHAFPAQKAGRRRTLLFQGTWAVQSFDSEYGADEAGYTGSDGNLRDGER